MPPPSTARSGGGPTSGGVNFDMDFSDDEGSAPRGKAASKSGGSKATKKKGEGKKKPPAKQAAKPAAAASSNASAGSGRQPPKPRGSSSGGMGMSMLKDPMAIDFGDDDLSMSDMDADMDIEAAGYSESDTR